MDRMTQLQEELINISDDLKAKARSCRDIELNHLADFMRGIAGDLVRIQGALNSIEHDKAE